MPSLGLFERRFDYVLVGIAGVTLVSVIVFKDTSVQVSLKSFRTGMLFGHMVVS